MVIIPKFAIAPNHKWNLLKRSGVIFLMLFLLTLFILAATYFFPGIFLFLLGSKFLHLHIELVLSFLGACITLISTISFSLYSSKGWLINPWLSISINILFIIVGAFIFNFSTLKGVLLFNVFLATSELLLHGGFLLLKILRIDSGQQAI